VARTPRTIARDRLAALPFPVTHDRLSGIDVWSWRVPLAQATVTLRHAPDAIEAERIARDAALAAPALSVRVEAATIALGARHHRDDHLVILADLLASWGVGLHATHGITGVLVAWHPASGPPLSL
jgi:hypothetical protein